MAKNSTRIQFPRNVVIDINNVPEDFEERIRNGGITGRGYVIEGSGKREEHVDTDRVKNVTLEELARLVLDGTPIKRNETVEVEYAPECHVADKEEQASEADLL